MRGFFSKKETETQLIRSTPDCLRCKLDKQCKSPKMKPMGGFKRRLLIVGEAPGESEDKQGKQFVGKAGRYLRGVIESTGIDFDQDVLKINSINCHPEKSRKPTDNEIEYCRPLLINTIAEFKPDVILLLGNSAIDSLLRYRWKYKRSDFGNITKWRGWCIPDREFQSYIVPTFHPSYVQKEETNPAVEIIFKKDIQLAVDSLSLDNIIPSKITEEENVHILFESDAEDVLSKIYKEKPIISFDYETTGLKPHRTSHKIECISIAFRHNFDNILRAYSFMITEKLIPLWIRILKDVRIPKIGHNIKYEDQWSREILGTETKGYSIDTMLLSHFLDNRKGINSLKFLTYVYLGIIHYGVGIESFLISDSSNGMNNIHKANKRDLLLYCGLDSLFTYMIAEIQIKKMGYVDIPNFIAF